MRKRKWLFLLLLLMAASICVLLFKQLVFKDSSVDNTPQSQPMPKVEDQTPPANEEVKNKQPAQGRMELPTDAKTNSEISPREEIYEETMRRTPDKGIKVTPGVTFEPGKGISLQKPGSDERVQIRRDNTYHADEVKVQWEKKF